MSAGRSIFLNPTLTMLVVAFLVKKAGGSVQLTQECLDELLGTRLKEESTVNDKGEQMIELRVLDVSIPLDKGSEKLYYCECCNRRSSTPPAIGSLCLECVKAQN